MKKNSKLFTIFIILLLALVMLCPMLCSADAGNFAGGSNYGGSSSSSSSGGWSGSSYGGGYSGRVYRSGGSSDGSGSDFVVGLVIFVVIVAVVVVAGNGKKRNNARTQTFTAPIRSYPLKSISQLIEIDPHFSEAALCQEISMLYVQMQNAWQEKKWEPMRAHMTDALYNQLYHQLEEFIKNRQTNYVDRIAVMSVSLLGWRQDNSNDIITARLKTRIVDYVVDDDTGKIIRGSDSRELFMEYEWTLIRTTGVLTPDEFEESKANTRNCPSCGAPLDINFSAKCEYCGSIVNSSDYDWVISSIQGVSQSSSS